MTEMINRTLWLSLEDFLNLDRNGWLEIVHGQAVEKIMPASYQHVEVIDNLFRIFDTPVRKNHWGRVHTDGLTYILHIDEEGVKSARIPDFSFIRLAKIPKPADRSSSFIGVPDLAVEVVSPSERLVDLKEKVDDYLRYGTEQVWVLFPLQKELHQYTLKDGKQNIEVYTKDETLRAESLFPNLDIRIADLFAMDEF